MSNGPKGFAAQLELEPPKPRKFDAEATWADWLHRGYPSYYDAVVEHYLSHAKEHHRLHAKG
jgi:hypothetical protein